MDDLKKIKKHYGEEMMHLCRNLFPTILEQENLLFHLLESSFAHSKFLATDILENNYELKFQSYIYSLMEDKNEYLDTKKDPFELLDEAGYTLYECKTPDDIEKFLHFYEPSEALCTFYEPRLKTNYVFFAVKKNVDEIKRENFKNPKREDNYGTSVISIQFSKGNINTLSIKNRYNHTVKNPDATFSNNLENIILGLTKSFREFYHFNINQNNDITFDSLDYLKANDGKHYKFFLELNNIYYGPDNVIIDNFKIQTKYLEKEKYLVIDYFVIDLVNKKIDFYDNKLEDSFLDGLKDIKNIEITKDKEDKLITITLENNNKAYIKINKYNQIISYRNAFLETIGDNFLGYNSDLKEIYLSNAKEIGDDFLGSNEVLNKIELPNVESIGNNFLFINQSLQTIAFPNIIKIGHQFLFCNEDIIEVHLPNLEEVGDGFMHENMKLTSLTLLKLTIVGSSFLHINNILRELTVHNLTIIGNGFLYCNVRLTTLSIPNLEFYGRYFLYSNQIITNLNIPIYRYFENEHLNSIVLNDKKITSSKNK